MAVVGNCDIRLDSIIACIQTQMIRLIQSVTSCSSLQKQKLSATGNFQNLESITSVEVLGLRTYEI